MTPDPRTPTEPLRLDRDGPVAIVRLARPDALNALSNELIGGLMDALDAFELDAEVRAIVITGSGRAFSAGADIKGFLPHMRRGAREAVAHFLRPGQQLTARVEAFAKPVIAAVNGLAFGGGCELVEATHIAVAAASAVFSKAEINIGIIPTFGGTQRLPRNIGRKAATELILTGRRFGADEALQLGLVNRVVPDEALMPTALGLAREIASKPPLTVSAALSAIHRGQDAAIESGLAIEEASFAAIVPTRDAIEGVTAFVEKRPPQFAGR
ncbi:enoyl-CoA hydratase-related protein [Falsiroseomonas sp. HW251]|uniref:enoyl-CoA hydratase-related protein n=1 Tax=Falsiroseomonas sp. HW251 TaxID=3390998 RepID=UPI003D31BF91